MRKAVLFVLLMSAAIVCALETTPRDDASKMDLSGTWEFKLDPDNAGIKKEWFLQEWSDSLTLPGCLQAQGFGNIPGPDTEWWTEPKFFWWVANAPDEEIAPWLLKYHTRDNFKFQYFLIPDRHYIGAAWYGRDIEIPETWSGKQFSLFLERCHWQSQLWVDGVAFGTNNRLATPHVYDLGSLKPGKHRIAIRIDNSKIVDIGDYAHSVSEQTAGTWNGIVGRIELSAEDPVWIDRVRILPKMVDGSVRVKLRVGNKTSTAKTVKISADACGLGKKNKDDPSGMTLEEKISAEPYTEISFDYPMGKGVQLWDEFSPNRYRMNLTLDSGAGSSKKEVDFGVRDFTINGRQFAINGTTTFMRGNIDNADYPKTGYAPMDVESWRRVWKIHKEFGLNAVRFHSWCPPEAAFQAADEIGLYLAPEVGVWAVIRKQPQFDFVTAESKSILETFGHHPSFVMMALGNEGSGDQKFFEKLLEEWKAFDTARLYTMLANPWNLNANPNNMQYEILNESRQRVEGKRDRSMKIRYHFGWPPAPMGTEYQFRPPQTSIDWRKFVLSRSKPLIAFETGQHCSYPDLERELPKYTGYLKATYLEIARDQLTERGMLDQLPDFVEASGLWQIELTREEMEASFRTPELAGFHWLCLSDFTGQATAPVGLTDPFFDTKSYVDIKKVRQWLGPTVLLSRMEQRIFTQDETFNADIEISHYGRDKITLDDLQATLRTADGKVIKNWKLPRKVFAQGSAQAIGSISLPLNSVDAPAKLNIQLKSPKNNLSNDWNLWVYPAKNTVTPFPPDVRVVRGWDKKTRAMLRDGKTVLMLPKKGTLKGDLPMCFVTFYWTNFGLQGGQSSACGVLQDPDHPLFKYFPTEKHTNWQWWDLLTRCQPMILDFWGRENPWPKSYRPLIQPIDTWKSNRKLALVAEAKVDNGKLLICSIDIENDLDERPATRQFRKSLCAYLESKAFNPKTEINEKAVAELFKGKKTPARTRTCLWFGSKK